MSKGGIIRPALFAAGIGLVIGLFMIYAGIVNVVTRAKPEAPEPTYAQLSEAAFMGMTRGDWIHKKLEPNQILGRIAVVQSQTGDLESTVAKIEKDKLRVDAVRNQAVYDYLHNKVGPTEKPAAADIEAAKKIAMSIQDQLLKADALRRVGEVQLRSDPAGAKATLQEAVTAVGAPLAPAFEPPPPLFNPTTLLWPVGLAIFGFLIALMLKPLLAELTPARGKAVAEHEEAEEEEEGETEEAAEAPPAEVPMAEPPPVVDVPMAGEDVAAEAVAAEALEGEMPLVAPPPPLGSSALSRAAQEQQAGELAATADPKKTMMGRQAVPTQLARQQPKPTQLARQAPAKPTMIAPAQALPTKMADNPDGMDLPTGKTVKK